MPSDWRRQVTALVLAVPIVLATAAMLAVGAAGYHGWIDDGDRRPANSAEAAALGNASELLRLLRLGADPTRVLPVRPHVISSSVLAASTLEAAIWARQVQVVRLLDRHGAIPIVELRREMLCLAMDLDVSETVDYLRATTSAPTGCEPGQALAKIVQRTRAMEAQ